MTATHHSQVRRRGAILLIVLVLLALFAVIGLTFVIYSQSEAVGARINREAMSGAADVPDATAAVNEFFKQFLYDVPDYGPGVASALRGHSMGRMVYGYNPATQGAGLPVPNLTPYGGVGMFAETIPNAGNRQQIINFSALDSSATSPLVDPEHTFTGTRNAAAAYQASSTAATGGMPPGTYVGKNAGYTYPDRNNAYLAMMDPATGRIVVPSYHRPDLFGTLASTNPNWNGPAGRYRILRPRPSDHLYDSGDGRGTVSDFPFPPRNPDGTITGDVQNYRWGNGIQANDSVWLYTGMAPVKWRGRELQPMIAPLIVPLDGRVNLNVAGNQQDPTANPTTSHGSHQGFAAHEVNPRYVLPNNGVIAGVNSDNEIKAVLSYRNNNQTKPPSASKAISVNTSNFLPPVGGNLETMNDWSPLNWDTVNPQVIPNTNGLRTDPLFPIAGWDNNQSGGATRHPSLFNPYFEFETNAAGSGGGRVLKLLDIRETGYHYSFKSTSVKNPLYGLTNVPNTFTGAAPNNPSNRARALTTPISNSLSYAGAAPSFANIVGGTNLALNAAAPGAMMPPSPITAVAPLSYTTPPTGQGDTVPGQGYRSALALMGPVDLNRPLADYRGAGNFNTTLANLAATGGIAANLYAANRDRHDLAKDIFDRLVVATGAACDGLNPITGKPLGFASVTPGPRYDALRYLAQIAVNIVDQIDNDDVSTAFVWNPTNIATPNGPENDPLNFQPGAWEQRVVYGCEKTRLVLNEVYAEVTNDPADPGLPQQGAQNPFHVRFHIEVLNPLNAPVNRTGGANPTQNAPLGDGTAPLRTGPPGPGASSAYRILVFNNSGQVVNQLYSNNANIVGAVTGQRLEATIPVTTKNTNVEPNDGQLANTGFRHLAPLESIKSTDPAVFAPNDTAQVIGIGNGTNQLYYTYPAGQPPLPAQIPQIVQQLNQNRHSVVLQKLANPYLTYNAANPNLNPYVTIDSIHDITVNDAVRYGRRQTVPPRPGTRPAADQPDPNANAARSHARRAPMYGFRGNSAVASFAIDQQRSMTSHNPQRFQNFEWLNHLDRKLVNQTELLGVAATKPHEQLQYFVTSATGQTVGALTPNDKQRHLAPWYRDPASAAATNYYRALSMLQVKPFTYAMPHAGRQPGRININAIWHKDVLSALADPNGGNLFNATDVDTIWNTVFTGASGIARTPSFPNTGSTIDEGAGGTDRPFKSLGTSVLATSGIAGVEETILRKPAGAATASMVLSPNASRTHHYQQEELLRKLYNNVTTTSDTYMVVFTIGYFEIRALPNATTRFVPYLGKEAFAEIPGDLRVQYAAVVDRSMMATDPASGTTTVPPSNLYMTELVSKYDPPPSGTTVPPQTQIQIRVTGGDANGLSVDYEGRTVRIVRTPPTNTTLAANETNVIVFGSGPTASTVIIPNTATFAYAIGSGIGTITFPAGTFLSQPSYSKLKQPLPIQPPGTLVSNVLLGNPGPQTGFDVNTPAATLLIRDLVKLR